MKKILLCGSNSFLGNYIGSELTKDKNFVINLARNKNRYKKDNYYKINFNNELSIKKKFFQLKKKYKVIDAVFFIIGNSKKNYLKFPNTSDFHKSFQDNFYTFVNIFNAYNNVFGINKSNFIIISSIAGIKDIGAPLTYSVAKNSLNFFCSALAKNYEKKNFKINVISPGNILMLGNNWSKKIKKDKKSVYEYINNNVPNNKFCNPVEIYDTCKLLMKENNFLGSNIILDGGQIL